MLRPSRSSNGPALAGERSRLTTAMSDRQKRYEAIGRDLAAERSVSLDEAREAVARAARVNRPAIAVLIAQARRFVRRRGR